MTNEINIEEEIRLLEFDTLSAQKWGGVCKQANSFSSPLSLPPLIVEYRNGELSVRDGNTRFGAMSLLGWTSCWVIIWYNSESDYHQHNKILFGHKMG